MANKRVDATAAYGKKQPSVLEKMIAPGAADSEEQHQEVAREEESQREQPKTKGRTLKQVAFAIGSERERRLDDLAYEYNHRKGTRIGRNDIARYLIDTLTLDDLLSVDLREYKK